jgi:hypothetical protein
MFMQSEEFIRARRRRIGDIRIHGHKPNNRRPARMNLAMHGTDRRIGRGEAVANDRVRSLAARGRAQAASSRHRPRQFAEGHEVPGRETLAECEMPELRRARAMIERNEQNPKPPREKSQR